MQNALRIAVLELWFPFFEKRLSFALLRAMKLTVVSFAFLAATVAATAIPAASPTPLPAPANVPTVAAQEFNARALDYYRYRRDNIPEEQHLNARALDYYRYRRDIANNDQHLNARALDYYRY
ncbi:hypothetical protein GGI13_002840 [Coemansia sp. RSA 455]|nr:hypothetical protein GGI13_002840 [Coemansia sp. RSA 455]